MVVLFLVFLKDTHTVFMHSCMEIIISAFPMVSSFIYLKTSYLINLLTPKKAPGIWGILHCAHFKTCPQSAWNGWNCATVVTNQGTVMVTLCQSQDWDRKENTASSSGTWFWSPELSFEQSDCSEVSWENPNRPPWWVPGTSLLSLSCCLTVTIPEAPCLPDPPAEPFQNFWSEKAIKIIKRWFLLR